MNSYITIGYRKNGKSEILANPDVPYSEQKELFKTLNGDYSEVEIWSRSMGKVRQRRIKAKAKESKTSKVSKTTKVQEE